MLSHLSHVWLFVTLWTIVPGSSVHGILQARTLEWVATPSSRGLLDPGIEPCIVSCIGGGGSLPQEPPEKPIYTYLYTLLVHTHTLNKCIYYLSTMCMYILTYQYMLSVCVCVYIYTYIHFTISPKILKHAQHLESVYYLSTICPESSKICANSFLSCPILWDLMDYNPLGSYAHGNLQARLLERVPMFSPRGVFLAQG